MNKIKFKLLLSFLLITVGAGLMILKNVRDTRKYSALSWLVATANSKAESYHQANNRFPDDLLDLDWSKMEDSASLELLNELKYDPLTGQTTIIDAVGGMEKPQQIDRKEETQPNN